MTKKHTSPSSWGWLTLGVVALGVGGWFLLNVLSTNLPSLGNITASQAYNLIQRPDAPEDLILLDVRTAEEHAQGYLSSQGKDALNVDFYAADFQSRLSQLDRDQTYLVYCRSGNRSSQAVALMQQMGFKRLYNLEGGVLAWQGKNLLLER